MLRRPLKYQDRNEGILKKCNEVSGLGKDITNWTYQSQIEVQKIDNFDQINGGTNITNQSFNEEVFLMVTIDGKLDTHNR